MIRSWLDKAVARLRRRIEQSITESRTIHGLRVDVINTRDDIDSDRVFRRAEAVLDLVRAYQPARYAHLRRDLENIVVKRFPARGAYLPESKSCLLELTFMANESFSDEQVAASLIHEGTHARLDRLHERFGIASFSSEPARHERICRRAELAFGRAVPNGELVVQRALESLALADDDVAPSVDWREANRRVTAVDVAASNDVPRWVKRAVAKRIDAPDSN